VLNVTDEAILYSFWDLVLLNSKALL